jgi:hypothetical protein
MDEQHLGRRSNGTWHATTVPRRSSQAEWVGPMVRVPSTWRLQRVVDRHFRRARPVTREAGLIG